MIRPSSSAATSGRAQVRALSVAIACGWAFACVWASGCGGSAPMPVLHASVEGTVPIEERTRLSTIVTDGDSLLCLTTQGNLVRYDAQLRFAGDRLVPTPIATLSDARLGVTETGEVVRVARDLGTTPIARIDGAVWASTFGGGDKVVVFVERASQYAAVTLEGAEIAVPYDGLATYGKGRPELFFVDGSTLWFGISAGEWGGAVGRVDLASGAVRVFDVDPPYGFVRDGGRVLVHGGLAHLGTRRSYVSALEGEAGPRTLLETSSLRSGRARVSPEGPVSTLVPVAGRYFATVRAQLYEVSADLRQWTRRGTLPSTAIGMVALGDTIVIATAFDGLLAWRTGVLARVAP